MEIDNLLDQIDSTEVVADNTMKGRLTCIAVSGKSKEYLGKFYRWNRKAGWKKKLQSYMLGTKLGGHTTKLKKKKSAYAKVVKLAFLAVSQGRLEVCNTEEMCKRLNDSALTSLTSKIYNDYGQYMAPLETVLLISNFVRPVKLLQQVEQQQP